MDTAISPLLSSMQAAQAKSSTTHPRKAQSAAATAENASEQCVIRHKSSVATERLRAQIRSIAPHYRAALITGERGARKEEVARALHYASTVCKGPFVICDAGWMETLLQSDGRKYSSEERSLCKSLARTANGGTIFFPELGLFSIKGQRELLNFLECVKSDVACRVKVVASVSGDWRAMVAGGTLLSELRDQIGVVELTVTPLRERLSDFAEMAQSVFTRMVAQSGEPVTTISEEALAELQRRGWPGNDRELESTLRMAALMSRGQKIEEKHLPTATRDTLPEVNAPAKLQVSSMKLHDVVEAHVQDVLRSCEGNKLKASEVLGISRSTLYRMLEAATYAD